MEKGKIRHEGVGYLLSVSTTLKMGGSQGRKHPVLPGRAEIPAMRDHWRGKLIAGLPQTAPEWMAMKNVSFNILFDNSVVAVFVLTQKH